RPPPRFWQGGQRKHCCWLEPLRGQIHTGPRSHCHCVAGTKSDYFEAPVGGGAAKSSHTTRPKSGFSVRLTWKVARHTCACAGSFKHRMPSPILGTGSPSRVSTATPASSSLQSQFSGVGRAVPSAPRAPADGALETARPTFANTVLRKSALQTLE